MAGKVKKKGDDAPQSKTARASLRTGAAKAEFIAAADAPRIVPLGRRYARLHPRPPRREDPPLQGLFRRVLRHAAPRSTRPATATACAAT